MALVLKIGDEDLSEFVRVAHEDGLDPTDSAYSELQFSGSPAFSEGQAAVGEALSNREMVFPLILSAETSADLHQLVRDINQELVKGALVEYANNDAEESTFFDLEGGKFEPEYQFWITRANRLRGVLRLWTRPFGHTGTARSVASFSGTGPQQFSVTGVLGDAAADGVLQIKVGSAPGVGGGGNYLGWGVKFPAPSGFNAITQPQASVGGGFAVGSLIGASGYVGSQVAAWPLPTQTVGLTQFALRAQDAGRYRVLIPAHVRINGGSPYLSVYSNRGGDSRVIATAAIPTGLRLLDGGELTIATGLASQGLQINYSPGSPVGTGAATLPLRIDDVILLPVDVNVGFYAPNHLDPANSITFDARDRTALQRTAASLIAADLVGQLRGDFPRIPAVGSAASGPAQVVAFALGSGDSGVGFPNNDAISIQLNVRERWRYLR